MTTITCPQDVYNAMAPELSHIDQEELHVLLLTTRNHIRETQMIYRGTVNQSPIRIAEVIRPAIQINSPSLVAVHNHPSGDTTPSPEDIAITRELVNGARIFDIQVLDHIIIGGDKFHSIRHYHPDIFDNLAPPAGTKEHYTAYHA